ncbi:MAG: ABC transporter ATP-binding protein [Erysipelotrichaceae bacterium]|nr:ABC transporter ATP-binding protein [Erysipelotrichaceae bacterium]
MNIKTSNLSFKYYKKAAKNVLNSINLEIKPGSVNVLLGLNGCGKTTLIKLFAGLEKPLEGTIEYDGNNLQAIRIGERAKIFAYVPQQANVTNDIPVRQYLSYGTTNTLAFYEHPGKEEMERVEATAERLNISHLLDKNLGEISGGELQIVLIACSLIQNTEILLLDEPTSALDMKNQNLVLSILKEVAKEGKTIILSSHNPNYALYLDSNVVLIHDGVIRDEGSAKELIKVEKLKPIYGDHVCVSNELGYEEISFK